MSNSSTRSPGEQYDVSLPSVAGSAQQVLAPLERLPASSTVLDVGCGTGEPALTLASSRPDLRVLGVDHSPAYIERATAAASERGISNAEFTVMDFTDLQLGTTSVDAVLSRFAALLIGDMDRTAAEIARVLKPGGPFSIAPWGRLEGQAALHLGLQSLSHVLPADTLPDFSPLDDLAVESVRTAPLRQAGLSSVSARTIRWTYDCPDLDTWWALVTEPLFPLGPLFESLTPADSDKAYAAMADLVADLQQEDGSYRIPYACQLITGRR